MQSKLAIAALVLVLILVNGSISDKEQHLAGGQIVYLELAPVDPRSLMQGDYMALRFALANDIRKALADSGNNHTSTDGYVIVKLNQNNIGSFKAIYDGKAISNDEALLRYRVRHGRVKLATNAFFFQEGHAEIYEPARYGQFRVDEKGELLLASMHDKELLELHPGKSVN